MYCKKCGKFIGSESNLCDECSVNVGEVFDEFSKQKEENSQPVVTYSKEDCNVKKPEVKLGWAITALILSIVGFGFIEVSMFIAIELMDYAMSLDAFAISIVLSLIGCVPTVLSMVFAVMSIINFKATSGVKSGKRIPLLILSILSLVDVVASLLSVLVLFCLLLLLL